MFQLYCFSRLIFFRFQYKLDQRTSIYHDHRSGSKADLNGCSDHNESFGYNIIEVCK